MLLEGEGEERELGLGVGQGAGALGGETLAILPTKPKPMQHLSHLDTQV